MNCTICKTEKLSCEFSDENCCSKCDPPLTVCLRCLSHHFKKKSVCRICGTKVDSNVITKFLQLYEEIYGKEEKIAVPNIRSGKVIVSLMAGDIYEFILNENKTVYQLKQEINGRLKIDPKNQKLIFNGTDLPNGQTLIAAGLRDGSRISLLIIMYEISNIKNIKFDLYWGYPKTGRKDYLDGSCLIYAEREFKCHVDYRAREALKCVNHSGDIMGITTGHHIITIDVDKLPANITHLYFTLSAWNSPTIGHYPNPTVQLLESSTNKNLCQPVSFNNLCNDQAVIMYVLRKIHNEWIITQEEKPSQGNAKNYSPLRTTIATIYDSTFIN